jgi:hypothetical protein
MFHETGEIPHVSEGPRRRQGPGGGIDFAPVGLDAHRVLAALLLWLGIVLRADAAMVNL